MQCLGHWKVAQLSLYNKKFERNCYSVISVLFCCWVNCRLDDVHVELNIYCTDISLLLKFECWCSDAFTLLCLWVLVLFVYIPYLLIFMHTYDHHSDVFWSHGLIPKIWTSNLVCLFLLWCYIIVSDKGEGLVPLKHVVPLQLIAPVLSQESDVQ